MMRSQLQPCQPLETRFANPSGSVNRSLCSFSGISLTAEPGVLAAAVMPTYSEWSVTPMKSMGVSILIDRKSTRLNSKSLRHLVCRLLLEKKKRTVQYSAKDHTLESAALGTIDAAYR